MNNELFPGNPSERLHEVANLVNIASLPLAMLKAKDSRFFSLEALLSADTGDGTLL